MRREGYNREYYLKNREKFLDTSKRWRKENKDYNQTYHQLYYLNNKEDILSQQRLYRGLLK